LLSLFVACWCLVFFYFMSSMIFQICQYVFESNHHDQGILFMCPTAMPHNLKNQPSTHSVKMIQKVTDQTLDINSISFKRCICVHLCNAWKYCLEFNCKAIDWMVLVCSFCQDQSSTFFATPLAQTPSF
jgi:hypothetical protein